MGRECVLPGTQLGLEPWHYTGVAHSTRRSSSAVVSLPRSVSPHLKKKSAGSGKTAWARPWQEDRTMSGSLGPHAAPPRPPDHRALAAAAQTHPAHLFPSLLLPGLGFHLLDLQGVGLPPPHEKVVVPNTQLEDLWPGSRRKVEPTVGHRRRELGGPSTAGEGTRGLTPPMASRAQRQGRAQETHFRGEGPRGTAPRQALWVHCPEPG